MHNQSIVHLDLKVIKLNKLKCVAILGLAELLKISKKILLTVFLFKLIKTVKFDNRFDNSRLSIILWHQKP